MSMRDEQLQRERLLLGAPALQRLADSHVVVCGLGGVGSYLTEALARCGVGHLTLVDFDQVALSNINRQLYALHSTLGCYKADVAARRIADIDPACAVSVRYDRISADNAEQLTKNADFVADAIDDIPAKLALIIQARTKRIPIISAMGAAKRLNPALLAIADISRTHTCPLARLMRKGLRTAGIIDGVPVAFSSELPREQFTDAANGPALGSVAFVPAAMGLLMAGYIVRQLSGSSNGDDNDGRSV